MIEQYLQVERNQGVLKLILNDPTTRNAMGPEMAQALRVELDRFDQDPEDKVLLLTGQDPSFCSGANVRGFGQRIQDLEEGSTDNEEPAEMPWGKMEAQYAHRQPKVEFGGQASLVPLRINKLQKPSIAAVNGHAMGVGMGVALACDIRFASEKAIFSEAFSRMGLIPGDGSSWQLPRLIGMSNTLLLQYTGDRIDGNEAYRMGVVSKVFPAEGLMEPAMELATRLANMPTQSMALIKYLVHKSLDMSFEDSLALAHVAQEQVRRTDDHKEAVQAFIEKRQPKFTGR